MKKIVPDFNYLALACLLLALLSLWMQSREVTSDNMVSETYQEDK